MNINRQSKTYTPEEDKAMIYKPKYRDPKTGELVESSIYWYKFLLDGNLVRASTKQTNDKKARNEESKRRTELVEERKERKAAANRLGCREDDLLRCPFCGGFFNGALRVESDGRMFCGDACRDVWVKRHRQVPTLREFCTQRVEPWARSRFENTCLKNWAWYRTGIRALTKYNALADARLDQITGELASDFAAHRLSEGMEISTANNSLRVLRRILNLAVEWSVLTTAPKIKTLPGEARRERVITPEEEAKYLAAAPEPLASIATILADTGMRPEECFRLSWENVTWVNGRNGAILVTRGKTAAARRVIPMTPRVRAVLESRWNGAGKPDEGWVWPAPTRSGHVEPSSLRKQHAKAFKTLAEEAAKNNRKPVRPFVLYSFRHTFLTRLGQSGCDVWTLARIAGHSSIAISSRYVHPSENAVLDAISRLGGQRIGQCEELAPAGVGTRLLNQ